MLGAGFLETAVNLYFDAEVLGRDVAKLRDGGYHVVQADASGWLCTADAHEDLSRIFGFPDYYGQNWNAFNDCLRDVIARDYGLPAQASGLVMVLAGFDAFAAEFPDDAHTLLDIYAKQQQRLALIGGDHLICLVQSGNPRLTLAPVGATVPWWNPAEWLDRNRGLQPG